MFHLEELVGEDVKTLPLPGEAYRHYKGDHYQVVGLAPHTETEEKMVVYHRVGLDRLWARPLSMWLETVEHEGQTLSRFTLIPDS